MVTAKNSWDTNNMESMMINWANFSFSAKAVKSGGTKLVLLVLEIMQVESETDTLDKNTLLIPHVLDRAW